MKRLLLCYAGMLLAGVSMVGCCYRPGYVDPCSGVCYGGFWEPTCGGGGGSCLNPFKWFCNSDPCEVDDDDGGCHCHSPCQCSACDGPVMGGAAGAYAPFEAPGQPGCDCGPESNYPVPMYQPAVPMYQPPMPGFSQPVPTYSEPMPTYGAPVVPANPQPAPPAGMTYYGPPQAPASLTPTSAPIQTQAY
jgi:hypothetical protein